MDIMLDDNVLQFANENGLINIEEVLTCYEMQKNKEYLDKHENKIWVRQDGYYCTWLPPNEENEKRRLLRKKTQKDLESAIIDFYKENCEEPTLNKVFNDWLNAKIEYGEIQLQTFAKYQGVYKRYLQESKFNRVKIKNITEWELEDYIKKTICSKGLTSKGWGDLRTIINGIFKYAKKRGYTSISISQFMGDLDLSRKIFKPRHKVDSLEVFKESEVKLIIDYINKNMTSIIDLGIILAFQTGLRVGEISALKFSDLKDDILYVRRTEIKVREDCGRKKWKFVISDRTKGRDGAREVILTPHAVNTLKHAHLMNPFGEYLFSRADGTRINSKEYTRRLYRICNAVNITPRSMHKARKTYATTLINSGVNEKLIMKQLGHTEIETTRTYYYFLNQEAESSKREIVNAVGHF